MAQHASVNDICAFGYTIANSNEALEDIGRVFVFEHKQAKSRGGLTETSPEYGFKVVLGDGTVAAEITAGLWPFVRSIMSALPPMHSAACEEDCQTEIGAFNIVPGERE